MTPEALRADVEKCVKCGSCKALCPTYALERVESKSARGRVVLAGALMGGVLAPTGALADRLTSCLLCGLCEPSCPVGVHITEAVYDGIERLGQADRVPRIRKRLMSMMFHHPGAFAFAGARLGTITRKVLEKFDVPFSVPLPLKPFRGETTLFTPPGKIGRVALFSGCAVNHMEPELGRALVRVLYAIGYEVVLPRGEVCCGAPLRSLGLNDEARAMAEKNIRSFNRHRVDAVLSLCPTCTLSIGSQYAELAGQSVTGAMDAFQFLAQHANRLGRLAPALAGKNIGFHEPCHLTKHGGSGPQLAVMKALGISPSAMSVKTCCGFSQAMRDPALSKRLLDDRMRDLEGSDVIVSSCPGCMAQLRRGHPDVIHLIEAIAPPGDKV